LGSLRNGNGTETLGTAQNISRGVRMLALARKQAEQLGLGANGSDADFVGPDAIRGDALNVIV